MDAATVIEQLGLRPHPEGGPPTPAVLGVDLVAGQEPQRRGPAGWWQAASSLGDWTLVSCTVSPAFTFEAFELAPTGWAPA